MRHRSGARCTKLADLMYGCYEAGRFIFVIGNGGSGSNASHFCEDIGKGTLKLPAGPATTTAKKRFRILSLTDNTPVHPGVGQRRGVRPRVRRAIEEPRQRRAICSIAISGSGNSPNILRAVEWANRQRADDVRLHRVQRRQAAALAHHNLHVPLDDMGIVETIHLAAFHWVVDDLHRRISL